MISLPRQAVSPNPPHHPKNFSQNASIFSCKCKIPVLALLKVRAEGIHCDEVGVKSKNNWPKTLALLANGVYHYAYIKSDLTYRRTNLTYRCFDLAYRLANMAYRLADLTY